MGPAEKLTEWSAMVVASELPPSTRNTLVDATADGIVAQIDGKETRVPWSAVEGIAAALVLDGQAPLFVLSAGLADGRSILLAEIEPGWTKVVASLHLYLPGVEPFTIWGPRLIAEPTVYELYPPMRQ